MNLEQAIEAAIDASAIRGIREAVRKLLWPKPIKPEAHPNDRYFELLDRITDIAKDRQRPSKSE